MNGALLFKTTRDALTLVVIATAGVIGFEMLFILVVGTLSENLEDLLGIWRRLDFVRQLLRALISLDLENVTQLSLITIGFVHPFLLAVTWGVLVTLCSRVIVGEIDRGTADLLLALPLSRTAVYTTVSLVWIAASGLLCLAAWAGIWLGTLNVENVQTPDMSLMAIPALNLLAVCLAIGGVSMFVSSWLRRRGVAVAIIVGMLLVSFLVNFLEVFLPWVGTFSFLGLLHYYRPIEAVRDQAWPIGHLTILLSVAVLSWLGGLWRFARRDIPAM